MYLLKIIFLWHSHRNDSSQDLCVTFSNDPFIVSEKTWLRHTSVTSVFRSTRLLDVHAYVQLTTAIWLSHVYRHSATVLVAFAFQGPPSGTHSDKTYEAVTFPGNSSSVDLRHGCLSMLMCRWRIWEFFIEDALYKFTFWLIAWLID